MHAQFIKIINNILIKNIKNNIVINNVQLIIEILLLQNKN